MHNTILNRIRLILVCGLILTGIILGNTTEPTQTQTPQPEPTVETRRPTEAPAEPTNQQETETPTETTAPATEPDAATEAPSLQETEPAYEATPTGEWRNIGDFTLTAYCSCQICCGQYAVNRPKDENGNTIVYTATGAVAKAGTTIAVDPRVIPYGTEVQINGHTYIAQDTGGAIKGNRIDVYFDDHQAALQFGRQNADVYILA